MPTGKTVIRLCGSSFVEFCSQMRKVSLLGRQCSGMRPLIMIVNVILMSRVCQIWVIFCVDSRLCFGNKYQQMLFDSPIIKMLSGSNFQKRVDKYISSSFSFHA